MTTPGNACSERRSRRSYSVAPKLLRNGLVYVGDSDGQSFTASTPPPAEALAFEPTAGSHRAPTSPEKASSRSTTSTCLSIEGWQRTREIRDTRRTGQGLGGVVAGAPCRRLCSTLHVLDTVNGKDFGSVEIGRRDMATAAVAGTTSHRHDQQRRPGIAWKNGKSSGGTPLKTAGAVLVLRGRDQLLWWLASRPPVQRHRPHTGRPV